MTLVERLSKVRDSASTPVTGDEALSIRSDSVDRNLVGRIADAVRVRLAEVSDPARLDDIGLRVLAESEIDQILAADDGVAAARGNTRVRAAVIDELLGFGPLQDLLDDPTISEIMVNGTSGTFVEVDGTIQRVARAFDSEDQLRRVIERMVHSSGRRVDQSSPMVDARLPDGSRLNVVLPPVAVDGPAVSIRKFTSNGISMSQLVSQGSLSDEAAAFLERAVAEHLNVVVSGGTGTGKTTILNILSSCIDPAERIVTVEDAVELDLDLPNLVRLEARPSNAEGAGEVTIRDLVRNALRMRPNRIVVGEVRGAETIDMLQAMNTGHEGSLSTVHANSPRDALRRLETMILLGGVELPLRAIREQIASSIDLVVHLRRSATGQRYVDSISEVTGSEGDVVSMAELFTRAGDRSSSDLAPLVATNLVPHSTGRHRHS